MIKKSLLAVLTLLLACPVLAQSDDPVLMTIAGQDVRRSEFEYALNKNTKGALEKDHRKIEAYVPMFVNYKLKVRAALDARLDTTEAFQKEFKVYRDAQLKPYLSDENYIDSVARNVYAEEQRAVGDSDLLRLSHIMIIVPQKADAAEDEKARQRIDSIYQVLKQGGDFAVLARKYSDDKASAANGGELPLIGPKSTLPEFERQAYALKAGEMSKPFRSTMGYHIILMRQRSKLEPYDVQKAEIVRLLKARGIEQDAQEHKIAKMISDSNGKLTREDVMRNVEAEAVKQSPQLQYLINEYHDGLLLYNICDQYVWKKAAADKKGKEAYYKKNRKRYVWDEPHFKGYVIQGHTQKLVDDAVNYFNKQKDGEGIAAYEKQFIGKTQRQVGVVYGVYGKGDNKFVDYLRYGGAAPKTNRVFPYYGLAGRMISKPETYTDVLGKLTSDYQDHMEQEWVKQLHKRYDVKINSDVLATVNKH